MKTGQCCDDVLFPNVRRRRRLRGVAPYLQTRLRVETDQGGRGWDDVATCRMQVVGRALEIGKEHAEQVPEPHGFDAEDCAIVSDVCLTIVGEDEYVDDD